MKWDEMRWDEMRRDEVQGNLEKLGKRPNVFIFIFIFISTQLHS